MTDDRTPNPCDVATQERHARLLQRIIRLLRLPQRRIYVVDRRLERRKLHHRIRYLPAPQRIQALIQAAIPFLLHNLAPSFPHIGCKGGQRCLHTHFDRFEWAEGQVGEEFCTGGCAEVDDRFVGVGEEPVAVEVLEDLVEAVFAGALEGVADEGWGPAEEDASEAFFGGDGAPGLEVGGVDFGVDLAAAFHLDHSRFNSSISAGNISFDEGVRASFWGIEG